MEIKEKTAYLKGLADGLEYDKSTKEGKLLAAIIDLLDEIAVEIDGLNQDVDYLSEYTEELDKDLGDVEEYIFDDDEDFEDEDDYEDECDGDCENCPFDECEDRLEAFEDVDGEDDDDK